jgi:hypothetical protein
MGNCWANDSIVPLYEFREPISVPGLDMSFQKYQGQPGYTNVTQRLLVGIVIEILFCLIGVVYYVLKIRLKLKKGLGYKLVQLNSTAYILRFINLFYLTMCLFSSVVSTCLCAHRNFFYE